MATITRLTMIKFLELILVFVLLILEFQSRISRSHITDVLILGTFGGFLIIFIGLFSGGLMSTPVNRRVDLFFSVVGCVLFFISGAIIISQFQKTNPDAYSNKGVGLTKGAFSLFEGVLLLVDAVLTFRGEA